MSSQKKTRFLKPGWIILFLVLIAVIGKKLLFPTSLSLDENVTFESGDTMSVVYDKLSSSERRSVRWYLFRNKGELNTIQLGNYVFSGSYTPASLIETINNWPTRTYEKITILEGRSIYDIDAYLTKQWYTTAGEYVSYVSSQENITTIAAKYPFVQQFLQSKPATAPAQVSLEGLLYPDTYHINPNQPVIDQLVSLQLKAFQTKVFWPYQSQIDNFASTLQQWGYSFTLGRYNIVTLASIVEKEERNNANKPTIAGIFLNRTQAGMRIDADITLCYGLKTGYEICTPSLIVRSISDATNLYNTRVHSGLTPTPIANPSAATFKALLEFNKTDNYYYLHWSDGKIYYGTSISEHNANKQYL